MELNLPDIHEHRLVSAEFKMVDREKRFTCSTKTVAILVRERRAPRPAAKDDQIASATYPGSGMLKPARRKGDQ
jgi:hypothetical protein